MSKSDDQDTSWQWLDELMAEHEGLTYDEYMGVASHYPDGTLHNYSENAYNVNLKAAIQSHWNAEVERIKKQNWSTGYHKGHRAGMESSNNPKQEGGEE